MTEKKDKLAEAQTPTSGKDNVQRENKVAGAFKDRDWNEIKGSNSWTIFKVMAEFVEGFEKLTKIGPCVSIFGSARTQNNHNYYKMTEEIASKLVQHGYNPDEFNNALLYRFAPRILDDYTGEWGLNLAISMMREIQDKGSLTDKPDHKRKNYKVYK